MSDTNTSEREPETAEREPEREPETAERDDAPTLPHATQKTSDDNPPPLYIKGFGVMGQSVPDVATGSTPVTRHDD